MKNLLLLFIICFACFFAKAQYYYNDIIALQTSQKQYMALKTNHIKTVTAISYESDNTQTENFKLEQQIAPMAQTISIYSSDPSTGRSTTVNTYRNNELSKTIDSSANVRNTISYEYDEPGKLHSILTVTEDTFMKSHSEELHLWLYKNDIPYQMLRIKDKTDTTLIILTADEHGNIVQEDWKKKNRTVETYYYYYNSSNQLTDIVRYNEKAKKMLPDFLFDYDETGKIIKTTQVPAGSSDYMIWKYVYTPKGLKKFEQLFNKQEQLVGRIEFQYE